MYISSRVDGPKVCDTPNSQSKIDRAIKLIINYLPEYFDPQKVQGLGQYLGAQKNSVFSIYL